MANCQQCGTVMRARFPHCSDCVSSEDTNPTAEATDSSDPQPANDHDIDSGPMENRRTLLKLGGITLIGGGGLFVLTSDDESGDDGQAGSAEESNGDEAPTETGDNGAEREQEGGSGDESADAAGLMVVPRFSDDESATLMDLQADEPTLDLVAAKVYDDGSVEDISEDVDWVSTNDSVLSVTASGKIQYAGTDGVSVITAAHPDFQKAFRIFDFRPALTAQTSEPEPAPVDDEIAGEMEKAGLGEWISDGVSEAWDWTVDSVSTVGESIWSGIKYEAEGLRKLELLVADNLGGHNLSSMGWDHSEEMEATLTGPFIDILDDAGVKTETIEENLKRTNLFEEGAKTSAGIATGDTFGFYVPGSPYPYQYRSPAGQVFWQGYYDTMIFESNTAAKLEQGGCHRKLDMVSVNTQLYRVLQ